VGAGGAADAPVEGRYEPPPAGRVDKLLGRRVDAVASRGVITGATA
jgi:hypothetical protein